MPSAADLPHFVCGANEGDQHYQGVVWGRDLDAPEVADLLLVREGDGCPRCSTEMDSTRGIEVGHIFKLGTKYSEAMKCNFTNEEGQDHPMIMGCYGLGIGRTIAAAIEQNHDDDGIIWPVPIAPFPVTLLTLNVKDAALMEASGDLVKKFEAIGIDVLWDDRKERPGVKFKDADLVGSPVRVVIGGKSYQRGEGEVRVRRTGEETAFPLDQLVARVDELLGRIR